MKNILSFFRPQKTKSTSEFVLAGDVGLQEGFLDKILDLLPGVIFIKDVKNGYRFSLINREAEAFFGYKKEEMIGKKDGDFFKKEEADFFHQVDTHVIASGKVMDVPCEKITKPDGKTLLLHTRKVPIYDDNNEPRYLLGLAQDITQRVQDERELIEYKESLEQKVFERTQKLTDAMQKAEEANRLKSDFLATMSHEIRSPMSGVLGMAELLLETEQTVEQKNLTRTIINCGEALLNVIEDILDFSKIEANKLEINPVPVDMLELVNEVCALYSPKAREKALELAVRYVPGTEQFVYADPVRIRQILGNLINNAIKFTKKGYIVVSVQEESMNGDRNDQVCLAFSIKDTGIGIAPDAQERIFEKFAQGDASTTRDYGGTGLGLSISRRLTEIMGGDIRVDSAPGKGSTFTFSLPLKRNTQDVVIQPPPPSLDTVRILIVDDLDVVCLLVEEQLRLAGMRPDVAGGGAEALAMIQKAEADGDPYQIALIDYLMPDMNGEALARAISDDPKLIQTCLIMMTAAGTPIVGDEFARKGFSAYMSKPIRNDLLLDMLSYVWTQYQAGKTDTLIRVDAVTFDKDKGEAGGDTFDLDGVPILLAEDSRINQAFAQEVLEGMGCRLTIASNGREALDTLRARKDIQLVLMDCQMPVMDGYEAARQIMIMKQDGSVPMNVPVIALTANAMEGDRQRCLDAGMNDYLSKPVRRKELREMVYRWVNRAPSAGETTDASEADLIDQRASQAAQDLFGAKYTQTLTMYYEDMAQYLVEIRDAIDANKVENVIRPVHTIKSNSRSMGAARLADIAKDGEALARAMHEGRCPISRESLMSVWQQLNDCFEQTKERLDRPSEEKIAQSG